MSKPSNLNFKAEINYQPENGLYGCKIEEGNQTIFEVSTDISLCVSQAVKKYLGDSYVDPRDYNLVYYGPHPCQRCDKKGKRGTLIVKAGNGAPDDLEFDFEQDSHYPNHEWKKHVCGKKNLTAAKMGSITSPDKAAAARENGKKGGRPRKLA